MRVKPFAVEPARKEPLLAAENRKGVEKSCLNLYMGVV
jgi:hypothetical protein